jgi:ribosomal protein S18
MNRPRDRLFLTPNWHVDCRLVAELPEDSVVGVRFMTYAVSCALALAAVLFTGWYAYEDVILRHQIDDASQRLEDDRWDVIEIRRLQRFYEIESKKIESAYSEIKNPILLSAFTSELGRTLPERMTVDSIEYGEGRILIRGRLRDSSEAASILLGKYLEKLRSDPEIGPHFNSINVTDLDRSTDDEQIMVFALTLRLKARTP